MIPICVAIPRYKETRIYTWILTSFLFRFIFYWGKTTPSKQRQEWQWSNRQQIERQLNLLISKCIFSLPTIAVRLKKCTYRCLLLSSSENDQNCVAILIEFFLEIELYTCRLCFPYLCHGDKAVISFSSAILPDWEVGGMPNHGSAAAKMSWESWAFPVSIPLEKTKSFPHCVECERNLDLCRYGKWGGKLLIHSDLDLS